MIQYDFGKIGKAFGIPGDFMLAIPYGTGHINDTFQATFNQSGSIIHYTIQRINTQVFKKPTELMENVARVCDHLSGNLPPCFERSREALQLLRTEDGKAYYYDADHDSYFRAYFFVEHARTYDIIDNDDVAFSAAKAFGRFLGTLASLPAPRLHETIPDFHNTPKRYEALLKAVEENRCGRVKDVGAELDFVARHAECYGKLIAMQRNGELPERITHNDTKINNVLMDDFTGRGICVIDLDTVMPGLVHYDFGDLIRTGTSPAAEDEPDTSKIYMQFNRFEALLRGYLAGAGKVLTETERELLPFAGQLITTEIGIRFLADYLEGDVYFKTHRPNHNLDRCRSQFKLASSIEEQMPAMQKLLKTIRD